MTRIKYTLCIFDEENVGRYINVEDVVYLPQVGEKIFLEDKSCEDAERGVSSGFFEVRAGTPPNWTLK